MIQALNENPTATMLGILSIIVLAFGVVAASFSSDLDNKVDKDAFEQALDSIAKETQSIRDDTAKEFDRRERVAQSLGEKIDCLTKELSILNSLMARIDERWMMDHPEDRRDR